VEEVKEVGEVSVDSEIVQTIMDRFPGLAREDVLQAVDAMYAASSIHPVLFTLAYNPISRARFVSIIPGVNEMTEKLALDVSDVLHELAQALVASKLSGEAEEGGKTEGD